MPCQYNCDVNRLNFQLKDIKIDKIKTLREIYEVTDQLGRDHPHRRDEMTRSKIEIDEKLMTAVAELLCIEDEISRGCTTCRDNWNPQTKLSIRLQKSRTPPPAVPSSNDMWQEPVAGLLVWRKWHYQEMTMSCGRTRGSWPVARCLIAYLLISGWYNIFSLLNILDKLNVVVK